MSSATRISATETRDLVNSGKALLICAYNSDEKFHGNQLEGSISLSAFKTRLPELNKDTELVFYCA